MDCFRIWKISSFSRRSRVWAPVWKLHHTSIGDNSTAIRSPLLTIQTILFRDSSREIGLRPQILASTTGKIINHYQNFFYSNRIKHEKQKHIVIQRIHSYIR